MPRHPLESNGAAPIPPLHYSSSLAKGPWLFVAGQTATDWRLGLAEEASLPHLGNSARVEWAYIYMNMQRLLRQAGVGPEAAVRLDSFYTPGEVQEGHFAARDDVWGSEPEKKFASTAVQVRRFLPNGTRVMVDMIANLKDEKRALLVEGIRPSPVGIPMAVVSGDFVFLSGRMAYGHNGPPGLAEEARTATSFWPGFPSPARAQTNYLMELFAQILEGAGSSLERVAKANVYLLRPDDITFVEEAWQRWFPAARPARSFVIADAMALVGGVVEINLIATLSTSRLAARSVNSTDVPAQPFNDPHAVEVGPFVFMSGQTPFGRDFDVELKRSASFPFSNRPGRWQMELTLDRAEAICVAAGASLKDLARVQTYFSDLEEFDAAHSVWADRFPSDPPAWTIAEVSTDLPVAGAVLHSDIIVCRS